MTRKPDAAAVSAVVLAAGAASRFGGVKLLAELGGRPVLQHVLDALDAQGFAEVVVVLGDDGDAIERAIDWRGERRVRNPDPGRGLSSSLSIGLESISPTATAALIALGDQPGLRADTVLALLEQPDDPTRPVVVPRYDDDAARNPVRLGRAALGLAAEATGDRGLGPVLEAHRELVQEVPVAGSNPDVDTPADLARAIEASWAARVRANREQVDMLMVDCFRWPVGPFGMVQGATTGWGQ